MIGKPFIHKVLSFHGTPYIYDAGTSEVFSVSKVVFDVVDDPDIDSPRDIIDKWKKEYDSRLISQALDEISSFQAKGYFLPCPGGKMSRPVCEDCLDDGFKSKHIQLTLNLTHECNMRCKYCAFSGLYKYQRTHSKLSMSTETAMKAIDAFMGQTQGAKESTLSFYGGEPLVQFDRIVAIVNYAMQLKQDRELHLHLTTNGTLLDDTILEFLIAHNVQVQISLDGPRDVHDRYRVYRNGDGTFDRIMANIRRIKSRGSDCRTLSFLSYSATIAPPYEMPAINEFFEQDEFSNDTLMVNYVDALDTTFFDRYFDGDRDINAYNEQVEKLEREYISDLISNRKPTKLATALFQKTTHCIHIRQRGPGDGPFRSNGICIPGERRYFVDVNGDIRPCERVQDAFVIGSVLQGGVDKDRVLGMVDEYISKSEEECSKCWAVRLCGLCFSMTVKANEFDIERKRENCLFTRSDMSRNLSRYLTIMEKNAKAFDNLGIAYF
jgi:uncharacterized protein